MWMACALQFPISSILGLYYRNLLYCLETASKHKYTIARIIHTSGSDDTIKKEKQGNEAQGLLHLCEYPNWKRAEDTQIAGRQNPTKLKIILNQHH